MHKAADRGRADVVEFLISRGAEVNTRSDFPSTPLHNAANGAYTNEARYVAVVKLLLAHRAEVNARMRGNQTPLHRAALWGRPKIMEALLAGNADPSARDDDGKTAWDIAKDTDNRRVRADVAARRSQERCGDAEALVGKALKLARPKGREVVDLCCGPGRWSIPLAKRGFRVAGVDLTKRFLDQARAEAKSAGVRIEWVQQDMRDFVRPGAFDLALSLFTSFGCFDDKGVSPKTVRRGIGRSLVEVMERAAKPDGLSRPHLNSTLNAVPFHKRLGYVQSKAASNRLPTGLELLCVTMTKDLI